MLCSTGKYRVWQPEWNQENLSHRNRSRATCSHQIQLIVRWLNPVSPPLDAGSGEVAVETLEMVSPFLPSCQPRSSPNLRSPRLVCDPDCTDDDDNRKSRLSRSSNVIILEWKIAWKWKQHFWFGGSRKSLLIELKAKNSSLRCPQAVEMGRGGLMMSVQWLRAQWNH